MALGRTKINTVVLDLLGNALAGASIQVYLRGTNTPASVYQQQTGATQVPNPLTTGNDGRVSGWLDRGSYDLVVTGVGIASYTEQIDSAPGGDGTTDAAWLQDGAVTAPKLGGSSIQRQHYQEIQQLDDFQQGVMNSGDFKVPTSITSGANFTVPQGIGYITDVATGLLLRARQASATTLTAGSTPASNPRVDIVYLTLGAAGSPPTVNYATGTPTAGAQITNFAGGSYRAGAPTLPPNSILLADLLVTTGGTWTVVDRRGWTRGYFNQIIRTGQGSNPATTATSFGPIDSTNLAQRVECSGNPLRIQLVGEAINTGTSTGRLQVYQDGAQAGGEQHAIPFPAANSYADVEAAFYLQPTPGSHLFVPYWKLDTASATLSMFQDAGRAIQFIVEEIMRQNASNT